MTELLIRPAVAEDLPELLAIYNDEVLTGTATFDTVPLTLEERRPWLEAHNRDNHPLWVAVADGIVAGYISLSTFNPKKAYDGTVELSVYVARRHRGQGIGRKLMSAMIDWARSDALTHRLVSLITAENAASIALHAKLGFRHVGTLTEAGRKFDRFLDVQFWELAV